MPRPALVGYWETWAGKRINSFHDNYNVIQIAFATTAGSSLYDMRFSLPSGYSKSLFLNDLDDLHANGKVAILSIGGANDPVRLTSISNKNTFVSTVNAILEEYDYKIDGIDLDFESSSLNYGAWTMSNPASGQTYMIDAVKEIMANYESETGKKLLLTMAPETVYVQGGMSSWQVQNINGGAYLPLIEGLRDELDLIHCQLYNAGGSGGGSYGIDGGLYYDTGDPDYITAMTDAIINGFTIQAGKGSFSGLPESKVAIGLPASYNGCISGIGVSSGFVDYADACDAMRYIKGELNKPAGWSYTLQSSYPSIGGMMTWSANKDESNCEGTWRMAETYECAFPVDATATEELSKRTPIQLYPNPTEDIMRVEGVTQNTEVVLLDVLGQEVMRVQGASSMTLDLSEQPSGIYVMMVGNESYRVVKD
jgi:chitinase